MTENKKGQLFAAAQQVGKALFLPIAVLPFAGILLGIGSSFTNETTIATYGLSGILHPGSGLYGLMLMLANAGNVIFGNLALIFALAVAMGMARKEKGVAVLSAAVFYLIMLTTIHTLLVIDGSIVDGTVADTVKEGAIASVLGIQTLQMGVFGGIIAGLITAALCNRFYKIQLPSALAFFAGTRFVPIACMAVGILTGTILYVVWPLIQNVIYSLGSLVQASGYFGTFLYGCIERALIPFGLHHIFYLPFWQTGVGGTALINGVTVMGAQNIFFAELASSETTQFSVEACRFLTGKYPFMMGGLPGAALAMYVTARPEKKKLAGSLLLSVGFTSFLTGITEPIEFTFLFLAPALFVIHVILAGLSFATCHILNICVGTTFSDGLIDLILYGVLPGQQKSNWMMLIPVILIYFVLYFLVFRYFILKWDLKTPGRELEGEAVQMMSKAEYQQRRGSAKASSVHDSDAEDTAVSAKDRKKQRKHQTEQDVRSAAILQGIGGKENLEDIDCCATRLRLTVKDGARIDEAVLRSTGASGVIRKGNGVQIIYGPSVTIVKSNLEDFIEKCDDDEMLYEQAKEKQSEDFNHETELELHLTLKKTDSMLNGFMNGRVVPLSEVPDEAFASGMLGPGVAIEPSEGYLYAPANGRIEMVFPTKHAVGMVTDEGTELILHIGINTVELDGRCFEAKVEAGQIVKRGEVLVVFDLDEIKKSGYSCVTPLVISNSTQYKDITVMEKGEIRPEQELLWLQVRQ